MTGHNRLEIIGNLGRPAELRYTQGGKAVLGFSVASTRKSGGNEYTTWVDVSIWGKRAESLAKLELDKGTKVFVAGPASVDTYEKQGGEVVARLKLTAFDLVLLGGGRRGESRGNGQRQQRAQGGDNGYHAPPPNPDDFPPDDFGDDDIPF